MVLYRKLFTHTVGYVAFLLIINMLICYLGFISTIQVLLDQEDAATYKLNEEITLLRWGNVTITHIETAAGE